MIQRAIVFNEFLIVTVRKMIAEFVFGTFSNADLNQKHGLREIQDIKLFFSYFKKE